MKVKILKSEGSLENLKRLEDPAFRVDVGFVQDGVAIQEGKAGAVPVIRTRPIYHDGRPCLHADVKTGERDAVWILVHEDKHHGRLLAIGEFSVSAPRLVCLVLAGTIQPRAPNGGAVGGRAFVVAHGCDGKTILDGADGRIHRVAPYTREDDAADGDRAPVVGTFVNTE